MSSPFDPAGGSPFEAWAGPLARLRAAVEEVLTLDPLVLSDAGLLACLGEVELASRRLPAARHGLVAEIDARGIAETHQQRSTRDLLRTRLNLSRGEAGSWVKQASEQAPRRDLTTGQPRPPRLASIAAAVRAGALSAEQAQLISATMRRVPASISTKQRDHLEGDLVGHAAGLSPEELAAVCRHALDVLDEDGPPPPEDLETRVGLVFGKTRVDGLTPFRGVADPETKAVLEAALAPLAKPVKSEHQERDPRSVPTRMLHALRDLAKRMLATGTLPSMAGMPATLLLTTTLEQLEARTGLVSVLNGGTVPVEDVIRMAAHMRVVPIVFNTAGEALWCGQEQRFGTLPIRRTTATQDRGCVIPGCDVPIIYCELHHPTPYSEGGETSAAHLAWVCPFHHHRITGWTLERINGRVWCTPPPWTDPTQTPRLNTYFHPPTLIPDQTFGPRHPGRGRPPGRDDQTRPPDHTKINKDASVGHPPDLNAPRS